MERSGWEKKHQVEKYLNDNSKLKKLLFFISSLVFSEVSTIRILITNYEYSKLPS